MKKNNKLIYLSNFFIKNKKMNNNQNNKFSHFVNFIFIINYNKYKLIYFIFNFKETMENKINSI